MSDVWTQSEGQIVDNKFRLSKYLAGTEHSAVFLTDFPGPQPKKAAIKFIAADAATADRQLAVWARVSKLSHPYLLQIFHFGRCRLERMDLLYVVLPYAEEDLSQVLPDRALTTSEAREMLGPLLEAVSYIHQKGFVHSHITPANIHAAGDQLKLAADTIIPSGDTRPSARKLDVYDAPETESSPLHTSSDIWSLGVTIVEVLMQRPPALPLDDQSNPTFPGTLPQPFFDIACHSLRRDPKRRWTAVEIAARLNPTVAAAAAGQTQSPPAASPSAATPAASSPAVVAPPAVPAATASASAAVPVAGAPAGVSPLAVPVSPVSPVSNVSAVPAAKLPAAHEIASQKIPPRPQPLRTTAPQPKQAVVLPSYVVPVVAAVGVILAIFILPKILGVRRNSPSMATSSSASAPQSAPQPTSTEPQLNAKPAARSSTPLNSAKITAERKSAEKAGSTSVAPAEAALRTDSFPPASATKSERVSAARGDVLDQVLPDVSDKARGTIHGRVRVAVRAHVDAAGNVSEAEFESHGPSKYFADIALKAVRLWEFTPPEIGERSVPSEWIIRFEFAQSGTKVFPKQVTP